MDPPVPVAVTPTPANLLEEWKVARDTCKTFDDLLMRVRTFALPLIATIVGAGSAFGTAGPRIEMPMGVTLTLIGVLAATAWLTVVLIIVNTKDPEEIVPGQRAGNTKKHPTNKRKPKNDDQPHIAVGGSECFVMFLVPLSLSAWLIMFTAEPADSFAFPAPVLLFGGFVLFFIYLLDRFYYTGLLLGAVTCAQGLEAKLGFDLTHSIVRVAPNWTYTLLPALLYLLPVIVLVNLGLAIVTFTG